MNCTCGKSISKLTLSLYGGLCRKCYVARLDKLNAEETEYGIVFHVLPEVKDEFAPRRKYYGKKRRECCHAVDAGTETIPGEALDIRSMKFVPTEHTEEYMTCPHDSRDPARKVTAWSRCSGNWGKEGVPCPYFRWKL